MDSGLESQRLTRSIYIAGGFSAGIARTQAARILSNRDNLVAIFAGLIFAVAGYMLFRSASALL